MFALVLIITQFLFLIFIGGFARTTQPITTSSYYLGPNILFLLSWTLMSTPLKKLTLTSLTILILISALTFECNLLFGRFWYSVFNQFATQFQLTIDIIVQCSIAIFPMLLITLDYIGIFRYWQIYMLLVPICNFMWSFNLSVLRYGLKMFDAGGGISVFLFAGVVSIVIWIVSVRQKHQKFGGYQLNNGNHLMRTDLYIRQQYYNGYTISLYGGLIGTFILWPSTNASTSLLSSVLKTLNPALKSSILFANTAYFNTILALSVGTICSFLLVNRDGTYERKQKVKCTIDCFINAGIICSCFIDIALNPAAAMGSSLLSTIITLVLYIYYQSIDMQQDKQQNISNFMIIVMYYSRALFRIILPLLSSIIAAIVVSNRQVSTVLLLDTATYGTNIYVLTAGFEIVAYFVTLVIGIVTGILCGLAINLFLYIKNNQYYGQQASKIAVGEQRAVVPAVESGLMTPQKVRKQPQSDINQSKLSKPIPRQQKLTDFNFLQLDQQSSQIFPLFLQKQDKYIDEQETARKLLKQAILSHVKSNYVSMNNYISVNKNKNVVTNNTMAIQNSQTRKDPRRKLELGIDSEFVMKNDVQKSRKQYVNQLEELTPRSGNSQIKNQTKEIVELVNKDRSLQKERSREAMPTFYLNHMIKSQMNQPHQMNRSKTQTNLGNQRKSSPPKQPQPIEHSRSRINHSGINVISKNSSLPSPPSPTNVIKIKKTKSQAFLNDPLSSTSIIKQEKKRNFNDINVISEIDRQEEEYRSRNVNESNQRNSKNNANTIGNLLSGNTKNNNIGNSSNMNNNVNANKSQIEKKKTVQFFKFKDNENNNSKSLVSKKQVKDDQSIILDQNQHQDILQIDSQFI